MDLIVITALLIQVVLAAIRRRAGHSLLQPYVDTYNFVAGHPRYALCCLILLALCLLGRYLPAYRTFEIGGMIFATELTVIGLVAIYICIAADESWY